MNEHLRDRILRRLDALSDERGYQVLDYVEFLESRYAERQTATSAFGRFTDAVEDRLRAGKVSATAIAETMNLMNRAANVLGGALAATQKMATELVSSPSTPPPSASTQSSAPPANASTTNASTSAASTPNASPAAASTSADSTPAAPASTASTPSAAPASSAAGAVAAPGSGEEKL